MIHPPTLISLAERVCSALAAAGREPVRIDVPDAETAKTAEVAAHCWSVLGTAGFTRSDAVVGVGGGATTDLAGFVAATWLRGVSLLTVPTSLLGMVDAAVGGKTGINTPEGKNLVGSFHEPVAVLCDLDALATLARADLVAGLAEVVKCGFIADPEILTRIESEPEEALRPRVAGAARTGRTGRSGESRGGLGRPAREDLDRFPGGSGAAQLRAHPGHAIERREGYRCRHGEAVSIGMAYAAALAREAGRLDEATAARHRSVLSRLGLPTAYPADAFDELLATMAVDKKARGRQLRFVILNGLASAEILAGPPVELLRSAYAAIAR